MKAPRLDRVRLGRCTHQEYTMMLFLLIIVCVAMVRLVTPEPPPDPRPLWDRVLATLLGLAQCFGLIVGVSVLLASVEVAKQAAHRYRLKKVERKLDLLKPLLRGCAKEHASPAALAGVVRLLRHGNDAVRQHALAAAFTLLRARPDLPLSAATRQALAGALRDGPGFARALIETPPDRPLLPAVTLGAKLGAGTAEKRLAPVTSDPAELARWVEQNRREHGNPEVQVSVGYDTGSFPWLIERARFLALYLFVSTTDLKRFQALMRRPPRDPNAAYGLVIRGDVVEVRCPGQARGHRLDYVFPLPVRLSTANLAGLFHEIQVLNLGLLLACASDQARVMLPGAPPPAWLDERRQAAGLAYRTFEGQLVALLRRFDRYREPRHIHRLIPADHHERVRAFEQYRLEECLYPHYSWVVPLYDPDTRWDRLIEPLRAVEGMLLHQGPVEDSDLTRGAEFVREVRQLGYRTAGAIEQALSGEAPQQAVRPAAGHHHHLLLDPFLVADGDEEAVRWYLSRVSQALARGQAAPEDLPDPATFRQAAAYYEISDGAEDPACARHLSREIDP